MSSDLPPCDLLARLTGRPVLLLDATGRVVEAGGIRNLTVPDRVGTERDLRRMAGSSIATPATWTISGQEYRAFGMRWPDCRQVRILVRLLPAPDAGFNVVNERVARLEHTQLQVRAALARALEAEAEMAATAATLRETNAELENYAALVAHDLRAPIRMARLLAGRATDAATIAASPERVADLGHRLDSTLKRLDDVVLRLLDYSRLRDNALTIRLYDAEALARRAIADLHLAIQSNDAVVEIEAAGSLTGDGALLEVVLRELVLNAIKHRSPDRTPRVKVTVESRNTETHVTVSDNGLGIPRSLRAEAFAMFTRLRTQSEGMGFGLAYCRRIVELHGGEIDLDIGPDGTGTAVTITLPFEAGAPPVDETLVVDAADPAALAGHGATMEA